MRSFFIISLLLLFVWSLSAQTLENPGTPEERAQKITQEMLKAIPLDTVQVDAVYALNLKYAKKAQVEIIDPKVSTWTMLRLGNKLSKEKEEELKLLISENQWQSYLKMKAAAQKKLFQQLF